MILLFGAAVYKADGSGHNNGVWEYLSLVLEQS